MHSYQYLEIIICPLCDSCPNAGETEIITKDIISKTNFCIIQQHDGCIFILTKYDIGKDKKMKKR